MTPQFYQILFQPDMVAAIHRGQKTVTRRLNGLKEFNINPDAFTNNGMQKQLCRFWFEGKPDPNPLRVWHILLSKDGHLNEIECPYGREAGDILWVRESFCYVMREDSWLLEGMKSQYVHKSEVHSDWMEAARAKGYRWTPSIHMPKVACKLWLKVADIKLERLHDITEEDAINEGIQFLGIIDGSGKRFSGWKNYLCKSDNDVLSFNNPIDSFRSLWISINGADSWKLNPWVWVIRFKHTYNRPEGFLS